VRLLAVLLKHHDGDLISALVAYNARRRRLGAPIPEERGDFLVRGEGADALRRVQSFATKATGSL